MRFATVTKGRGEGGGGGGGATPMWRGGELDTAQDIGRRNAAD